jgi:hypothetical protein
VEIPREKEQRRPDRFNVHDYWNCSKVKVQVVALTATWNIYQCLMDFHMSVVQNFITGWGCYSVHWESTFEKRGWLARRLEGFPEYEVEEINKKRAMGIELVPWKERDLEKSRKDSIFVVYWPVSGKDCGHKYISRKELESDLLCQRIEKRSLE